MYEKWKINERYLKGIIPLLSLVAPQHVNIKLASDPDQCKGLLDVLLSLSSKVKSVELELLHHFDKEGDNTADAYVQALTSGGCSVKKLRGRFSDPSILPTTLENLWIHCHTHTLAALVARLPSLQNLNDLCKYNFTY